MNGTNSTTSTPLFAFVHIFKTAGTTLTGVLRRKLGIRHFDSRVIRSSRLLAAADLRKLRLLSPSLLSIAGHEVSHLSDLHEAVPTIRYYTFLRDPLRRTLSSFSHRIYQQARRGAVPQTPSELTAEFKRIVEEEQNRQTRRLAGVADADLAIERAERDIAFVGLVERFDESLVMLKKWMSDEGLNFDFVYRSLNVSTKRHLHDPVASRKLDGMRRFLAQLDEDSELMQMVRQSNREDLKLYRHATANTYPSLQTSYGAGLAKDVASFRDRLNGCNVRSDDSLIGKSYRNLVLKPLRPLLFGRAA